MNTTGSSSERTSSRLVVSRYRVLGLEDRRQLNGYVLPVVVSVHTVGRHCLSAETREKGEDEHHWPPAWVLQLSDPTGCGSERASPRLVVEISWKYRRLVLEGPRQLSGQQRVVIEKLKVLGSGKVAQVGKLQHPQTVLDELDSVPESGIAEVVESTVLRSAAAHCRRRC